MKVFVVPEVLDYIERLTFILYQKGYFGFYENATDYVDKILDDIYTNLPNRLKKTAPQRFKRYGTHYITYKPNRRTTYYVFFIFKEDRYIVRYITNNHVSGHHIRGLR